MNERKYESGTNPCSSSGSEELEDLFSWIERVSSGSNLEIPYEDRRCHICNRPESELEAFDWPDNPVIGFVSGQKLVKNWRWDDPYQVGSTRECRDCFSRPEPIWWIIYEESRLGRRLTDLEIANVQREFNLEGERYDAECREAEKAPGDLSDS